MRTSIFIACICCLFSCGLFKKITVSKSKVDVRGWETSTTQQSATDTRSTLQAQTFLSHDSSETISMIEIVPSGAVSFAKDAGFKVEAQRIRIYAKSKTGKSVTGQTLKSGQARSESQSSSAKTSETKVIAAAGSKESRADPLPIAIFLVAGAGLIFVLVKFARKWLA